MKFLDLPHGNAALGIFPHTQGFAWMLFDGPISPVAWAGSTHARKKGDAESKNAACLQAIERLLQEHRPSVVVLEAFEGPGTRRHARVQALCRSIISLTAVHGVSVHVITRDQIRACFASVDPKTRQAFAEFVATVVPAIKRRLPEKRKFWKNEDPNMGLFNAAALLIVHYANPREPL